MDAATRKLVDETAEGRTELMNEMLKEDPEISHSKVSKAVKEKFGVGIDFYRFKEAKKPKAHPDRNKWRKAYAKKEKFARETLAKRPSLSFEDLNQLSRRQLNTNIPKGLYKMYSKKKLFKAKVIDRVKADLKQGTTPLKTEAHRFGKLAIECGVEEAHLKVIDGVPQWHIVEKRM